MYNVHVVFYIHPYHNTIYIYIMYGVAQGGMLLCE